MAIWVLSSGGGPSDVPSKFPPKHHHQRHLDHDHDSRDGEEPTQSSLYVNDWPQNERPVFIEPYPDHEPHAALHHRPAEEPPLDWPRRHQLLDFDDDRQGRRSCPIYEHGAHYPVSPLDFYIIREGSHSTPPEHVRRRPPSPLRPAPAAHPASPLTLAANFSAASFMERTASGLSISSDPSSIFFAPPRELRLPPVHTDADADDDPEPSLSDTEAAAFVLRATSATSAASSHRRRVSQPARILHSLIFPPSDPNHPDFRLDNDALTSLFHAANWLFFGGRLSGRVRWDWTREDESPGSSSTNEARYDDGRQQQQHIIGTTALRRCRALGGYETLIVLSSPILRDTRYNRRLLIATFLHEMIHSFLFVSCGVKAGREGGHTQGFRRIADAIDGWVGGRGVLGLGEVEADLGRFCGEEWRHRHHRHHCERQHRDDNQYRGYDPEDDVDDDGRLEDWEFYGREGFGGGVDGDRFDGGHEDWQMAF